MSEELRSCPFCGGKVKVILVENAQVDGIFYTITRGNAKKNNCRCRLFFESELMPRNASKWTRKAVFDDLVMAWNRRINDETN